MHIFLQLQAISHARLLTSLYGMYSTIVRNQPATLSCITVMESELRSQGRMSGEPSLVIEIFVGIFYKYQGSQVLYIVNITAALKRYTQR